MSDSDFEGNESRDFAADAREIVLELHARLGEGSPQPRLEPTRKVVEMLGDVHRAYPIIQVAGTNGKTSTARLIESILRTYGLRTGLFTSPHLVHLAERIQVDGEPIIDEKFVDNWRDIEPYIRLVDEELREAGEPRLTYFEVLSILAFAAFADAPVDVAVIEVGLGGEWDSTNVADADVAVFTPIDLDHMERLGSTIRAIAQTKSGIIKPDSLVVSAPQQPDAREVLREAAERANSTIRFTDDPGLSVSSTLAVGGQLLTITGIAARYEDIFLSLYGAHQAVNAQLAVLAVESFIGGGSQQLDPEVISEAFATVTSPGRLQLLATEPTVLVDAAHNPHGARSLATALGEFFTFDDVTCVFAGLADKDVRGMLSALAPVASRFIVPDLDTERAMPAAEIALLAREVAPDVEVHTAATVAEALAHARARAAATSEDAAVVVAGSIVLVGETIALAQATRGWRDFT